MGSCRKGSLGCTRHRGGTQSSRERCVCSLSSGTPAVARQPRDRLRSLQELEDFIAQFGEAGFVLVALGTVVNVAQSQQALEQMHRAFAQLPQGVIWKCSPSLWPKDVPLAANVKIVDWLPQSDLLGKGPLSAGSCRVCLSRSGYLSFRVRCSPHPYLGTPPSPERKACVSERPGTRKAWHSGLASFICTQPSYLRHQPPSRGRLGRGRGWGSAHRCFGTHLCPQEGSRCRTVASSRLLFTHRHGASSSSPQVALPCDNIPHGPV